MLTEWVDNEPHEQQDAPTPGRPGSCLLLPSDSVMAWFRRKPKLQDEALGDLAQMFLACPDDPTPGCELLDASRLDFSVKSLGVVDAWLERMRTRPLDDDALLRIVLRCGAYVGEVVRRHSEKPFHWLDRKGAARQSPSIARLGDGLEIAAVLWDGADGFCFPLGKVAKFLANGREDSVEFFAQVVLGQNEQEG